MHLHEGENPLLQVVKHADPHCMEEVGLREVTHNTGNMSKQVESMVNIARREFCISCLGVGLAERSTLVVIPPGGVACQEGHNLQVHYLDTCTKKRHATRDDVGCYTLGNPEAMLLQPVCNS